MNHQKEWQSHLMHLEKEHKWDEAVTFMKNVIEKDPDDMWAYISFVYMLMDLIVEFYDGIEYGDERYKSLAKKYFWESYAKFCNDSEYLYYIAIAVNLSSWFLDVSDELMYEMFERSEEAEPDNPVYQGYKYEKILKEELQNEKMYQIAQQNISKNSPTIKILANKGSIGQYLLRLRINMFCDMAEQYEAIKNEKKRRVWQNGIDFFIMNSQFQNGLHNLEVICKKDQEDVWVYIYMVYILGVLIQESKTTSDECEIYKNKMNIYFVKSYQKFADQFEYLFFMSIIVFYNKNGIDKTGKEYNEIIKHAFFIFHYGRGRYSFFYYLIHSTEKVEKWRAQYAQDIILYKNYLDREFLQAGSLRSYIIQCIEDASKIIIKRYEKEHNYMSLN